jgi:hypothetical protein
VEWAESGNMPDFAKDNPREFWVAADAQERANGRTYTELQVALPRELSNEQRIELARQAAREFMDGRFAYTMAVHNPSAKDKIEQPHMHLMFSERAIDDRTRALPEEQFFKRNGAKKDRETWHDREKPLEIRERWCEMMNRAMEKEGIEDRVDPRSWAEQGREDLAALVEPKTLRSGPEAMERQEQIAQLRAIRQELPTRGLESVDPIQTMETDAGEKIGEIERQRDQELSLLDQLIATVKEAMERIKEGVRSIFPTKTARPAAVSEHKTEARERQIPPPDPFRVREVEVFLSVHKKDFTRSSEAARWFDMRLEQLSTLQNPATGRALFDAALQQGGRTTAECSKALEQEIAGKQRTVQHYEGLIQKHEDPRTMWQKLSGKVDEKLERLHGMRDKALSDLAKPQAELQKIEARWMDEHSFWERKADAKNAQEMSYQQREAQELRDIRPDVLSECDRRDVDPAVQQARADERHLDYIVTELNAGSDPEDVRTNLLRWQLNSTSPEAQRHADRLMDEGQGRVQKQREAVYRELGLTQQNEPQIGRDFPDR